MSYLATLGTSSCATSAIGGFKKGERELNESYKVDPSSFVSPADGMTVNRYYDEILYPTSQPLGRTFNMPFTKLMRNIESSAMGSKLLVATLNYSQYMGNEKYWHKELLNWGFKLVTKTNNDIGEINYLYIRNPSVVPIKDGEEK